MSVRCKSKFTSYVKHYTRREKQGWFLVLKDICVSIKSASCVLNAAGWSYSDQMAFCLSLEICQAQLFSRTASVSGSSGERQDKPLLYYQSCGNQIFLPGSQRLQDGKNWAQTGAVLLQQGARQPGGVWSPEGNEKGGKDTAVLINHRVTPEHQLLLGRADLILGRGMSREGFAGALDKSPALLGTVQGREIPARKSAGKGQPETREYVTFSQNETQNLCYL